MSYSAIEIIKAEFYNMDKFSQNMTIAIVVLVLIGFASLIFSSIACKIGSDLEIGFENTYYTCAIAVGLCIVVSLVRGLVVGY